MTGLVLAAATVLSGAVANHGPAGPLPTEAPASGVAVLSAAVSVPSAAFWQAQDPDFELAPLDLRHAGIINTTVLAAYRDGQFYLPIGELFRLALIDHALDVRSGRVEGFFIDPDVRYELDAITGQVMVAGRHVEFDTQKFIVSEVEIYAAPEVFEGAFALEFNVRMETLTLSLRFDGVLPVVARADRRRRADQIGDHPADWEHADLLYGRERRLLAGGGVDYSIRSAAGAGGTYLSGTARVGFEALGGEVALPLSFRTSPTGTTAGMSGGNIGWRWRENPWLSELRAGALSSRAVDGRNFRGLVLTNRPIDPRRHFGTFRLRESVPPGWEVEVYRNQRLIRSFVIGEEAEVDLRLPLTFGTTDYDVRVYGPEGQVRELGYRLPTPAAFIPPGDIEYRMEGGWLNAPRADLLSPDHPFAAATTLFGISDWITSGVSAAVVETDSTTAWRGTHLVAARFFGPHVAETEVGTDGSVRLAGQAQYRGRASWSVELVANPAESPFVDSSGRPRRLSGQVYLPFSLFETSFAIRARVNRRFGGELAPTGQAGLDVDTRWGGWLTTVGYRTGSLPWFDGVGSGVAGDELRAALRGSLRDARPIVGEWLSRAHLRSAVALDPHDGQLREWETSLSRRVGRAGQIAVGLGRRGTGSVGLDLRYSTSLPQVYTATEVRGRTSGDVSATQTLRGSIALSTGAESQAVIGDRGSIVGHGGVVFRTFVDHSGSGRFDPGDRLITTDVVRFRQPVVRSHDPERGLTRVSGLRADGRYTVEVVQERVPNPLWMPGVEEFSFVVDPNRFKVIDLPFYVAGVVEGRVTVEDGDRSRAIPGIRVHLQGVETAFSREVSTFSDGSYYLMGIPPGAYTATVDADQREMLGVTGDPVEFEVRVTEHGDFVGGVNLTLTSLQD
jgi:hypothetical protein